MNKSEGMKEGGKREEKKTVWGVGLRKDGEVKWEVKGEGRGDYGKVLGLETDEGKGGEGKG